MRAVWVRVPLPAQKKGSSKDCPFFVQGESVRPPLPTSPFVGEEFFVVYRFFSIENYLNKMKDAPEE